ncbi:hypothetical protein D3C75_599860 [compost metagenome]
MSLSPISTLQKLGIPTNSYIAAAQAAGAMRGSCDQAKYDELIGLITGEPFVSGSYPLAQMLFGYLIQEIVRFDLQDRVLDMDLLFDIANEKAVEFVATQPWHWPEDGADGKVSRLDEVRRFIDIFDNAPQEVLVARLSEDFEVTKATAQGWLRQINAEDNLEAYEADETAPAPKKAEPKVRINKGEEAIKIVERMYTGDNKPAVIDAIASELNTTRGGAQTFFYAAIKKLQLTVAKPEKSEAKETTQERLKAIIEAEPTIDRKGFIDKAGELGVKATTAQTYYYALTASMGVERQGNGARGRKKGSGVSRIEQVTAYVEKHRAVPKHALLTKLSEEFTVSKVSAQSYYYAALKILNNKGTE